VSAERSQPEGEGPLADPLPAEELFLSPDAVPRRKNQLMAMGLVVVALVVLAIVVVLMLLIRYDNLPSLFSLFQ